MDIKQFAQFNFGEVLVSLVIKELISKENLYGYNFKNNWKYEQVHFPKDSNIHQDAVIRISDKDATFRVNKEHRLDIGVTTNNGIHPIEVKLGAAKINSQFPNKFHKHREKKIEVYEKTGELTGNMIGLLDRRSRDDGFQFNLCVDNPTLELSRGWSIVILEEVMNKNYDVSKSNFQNLEYVFVFENLWRDAAFAHESIKKAIIGRLSDHIDKIKTLK